jgi:pyruvate/2-oxoglutarate dehydrogenase complex dihydrolipoamide acyltransferase (E2) component
VVAASWQEIPQFQQQMLVDAGALVAERDRLAGAGAVKISLNHLILDCVVAAVVDEPAVNATYADDTVTTYRDVNLSVAVATDRGLLAPVIHRAQALSQQERAAAANDLAARAAAATLTPQELAGGTITVSNLGMYGVDTGFALVTRPQAAIVFVGAVAPRPLVVDGAVVARQSLYLSVTYDHRVVDGAAAARFLAALKRRVEGLGA